MANSPHRVCLSRSRDRRQTRRARQRSRIYPFFSPGSSRLLCGRSIRISPGYEVVKRAAARAFNVSITISIATIVGLIIPIILVAVAVAGDNRGLAVVALILMVVVAIVVGIWGIAGVVCHIIGAVKANAGETDYKYPLPALKILKD